MGRPVAAANSCSNARLSSVACSNHEWRAALATASTSRSVIQGPATGIFGSASVTVRDQVSSHTRPPAPAVDRHCAHEHVPPPAEATEEHDRP